MEWIILRPRPAASLPLDRSRWIADTILAGPHKYTVPDLSAVDERSDFRRDVAGSFTVCQDMEMREAWSRGLRGIKDRRDVRANDRVNGGSSW